LALAKVRRFDEARASWQQAAAAFASIADPDRAVVVREWFETLPPPTSLG
jgi:hypothetical protein